VRVSQGLLALSLVTRLMIPAVGAAVIAPEPEVRRWFSWPWYRTGTLIDDLVRTARLRRVDSHLAVPRGQTFDALP